MGEGFNDTFNDSELDFELMRRVKRGDMDAFTELVSRHRAAVFSYVVRTLGDETEAEDIAQQVFVQVYKSARRYRPKARFTTWLFTIARNLCLNELRRRRRHATYSIEELRGGDSETGEVQLPAPNPIVPDLESLKGEFHSVLEKAIQQLPEKYRTAVILFSHHGLSYEEIASVLGCSLQATKSILHRARLCLREVMKRYMEDGHSSATFG